MANTQNRPMSESTAIPGNIANDKTIDLKILSMHTETLLCLLQNMQILIL